VKNGTLYLASGKTGVDWSLLGRAFVGLASYDEISPGIRAAWLVMKKGKLNTGTLDTVKRVFGVEPKSGSGGGNTTPAKSDITVAGVEWEIKFLLKHGKKSEVKKMLTNILASL
jgi:hypothetical protein